MPLDLHRRRKRRRWPFVLVVLVLLFSLAWLVRALAGAPRLAAGSYLLVDLQGNYAEQPPDDVFGHLLRGKSMSMIDLLGVLRDAREDPRLAGIVVRVRPLEIGWGKAQDLREALQAFADSKKTLIAYLEHEVAGSTLEYYVATAAKKIYLPPGASAPLTGLVAQSVFLGGLWEKLDVEMQVEKIAEYKTLGDMLAGKEMSSAHREMQSAILDSLYGQVVSAIARARKLDAEAVRALVDQAPTTAEEFVSAGLADGVRVLDGIRKELPGKVERFVSLDEYSKVLAAAARPGRNKIAVIYGVGAIHTGESAGGGLEQATVGSDTMAEAFQSAVEDKSVRAIVFRIDSPGGSALASDLIWNVTRAARAAKPVIASMSDVAASGGYYVAAGASRIVAQPGTLTGSIGVVLAKPNVSGLLSWMGINTESMQRGELAGLNLLTASLSEAERQRLVSAMEHIYAVFLDRVAEGRSMRADQVAEIARGRVWTGEQARAVGLVDQLGGLLTAIDEARLAAKIQPPEKVELVFFPRKKAFLERLGDYLAARAAVRMPGWWRRVNEAAVAFRFPEGSVLTLMPETIRVR